MNRRKFISRLLSSFALISAATVARPVLAAKSKLTLLITELAGFQYYAGKRIWPKIAHGDELDLLREPGNSYDKKAVAIFCKGFKIGYVPRNGNLTISQMLDRQIPLQARIAGLKESNDPWQRINIEIAIR